MSVRDLKLHFNNLDSKARNSENPDYSSPEMRPNNVVKTQIPVAKFGSGSRTSSVNGPLSPRASSFNGQTTRTSVVNAPQTPRTPFTNGPQAPRTSPVNGPQAVDSRGYEVATFVNGNSNTATSPTGSSTSPERWRLKFEEAEKKRKALLSQNQKLMRDQEELQRKNSQLQRDLDNTQKDLTDRKNELNQLRKLSEAVYKEYGLLKNQYELERGTMQEAIERASKWYKENKELKRRSTVLMQRVMQVAPDTITDLGDDTDSGHDTDNDDFDELRKAVQDLNHDVARLQAEVNAARLQEFEAQETIVDLTTQLEEERNSRTLLESELKELRTLRDNLGHVSRLVAAEVSSLREQCEKEKETAQRMKQDADNAKKERNVLAHQSQLLLCEVAADQRLMQVVMEVENLKRTLEEEQQRHSAELQALQEKLEEREGEAQLELLEEKLKLAEAELQCALQRAERAETVSEQLSNKVCTLEEELEKSNNVPPPPPPPPMPPPPPPMPLLAPAGLSSVRTRHRPSCDGAEAPIRTSAVLDMANLLGLPSKTTKTSAVPTGAIDNLIDEIKKGRFSLKPAEPKLKPAKEEEPPVVQEMINVLGTLGRKGTTKRNRQFNKAPADVHL